jgi:GNAT superfamily N-acetyltransferase
MPRTDIQSSQVVSARRSRVADLVLCGDDLAGRESMVVRQLGPGDEAEILEMLRGSLPSGRPNHLLPATAQMPVPAMAWSAGVFVANELKGIARAVNVSRAGQVEVALFVEERWRRRGIGSALLDEVMNWARRGKASTIRLVCERTDWPMRHFAKRFGARLDLVLGQIVVEIPLAS